MIIHGHLFLWASMKLLELFCSQIILTIDYTYTTIHYSIRLSDNNSGNKINIFHTSLDPFSVSAFSRLILSVFSYFYHWNISVLPIILSSKHFGVHLMTQYMFPLFEHKNNEHIIIILSFFSLQWSDIEKDKIIKCSSSPPPTLSSDTEIKMNETSMLYARRKKYHLFVPFIHNFIELNPFSSYSVFFLIRIHICGIFFIVQVQEKHRKLIQVPWNDEK